MGADNGGARRPRRAPVAHRAANAPAGDAATRWAGEPRRFGEGCGCCERALRDSFVLRGGHRHSGRPRRIDDDGTGYLHSGNVEGAKHFGLWPLEQAAEACFGTKEWPSNVPQPQASIEFEVDDVAEAAKELEDRGYQLLHGARTEPWGQTVARLLSPEGLIVGLSYVPSMR